MFLVLVSAEALGGGGEGTICTMVDRPSTLTQMKFERGGGGVSFACFDFSDFRRRLDSLDVGPHPRPSQQGAVECLGVIRGRRPRPLTNKVRTGDSVL